MWFFLRETTRICKYCCTRKGSGHRSSSTKKGHGRRTGGKSPGRMFLLKKPEFLEKDGRTDIVFQAKEEEEEEEEVPRIDKSWRQSRSGRRRRRRKVVKSLSPPRQLLRIFSPSSNSSGCPRIRFSNNKKVIRRRLEKTRGETAPDEHMQKKRRKQGEGAIVLSLPSFLPCHMAKCENGKKTKKLPPA